MAARPCREQSSCCVVFRQVGTAILIGKGAVGLDGIKLRFLFLYFPQFSSRKRIPQVDIGEAHDSLQIIFHKAP